jgi:hypothetical protein
MLSAPELATAGPITQVTQRTAEVGIQFGRV